ncbi:MAG: hypothetical protein FWG55_06915 [Candidatus Bathyarchaeota archaeon]|nr:hypothetical protein [Candidatus Termiticorpusculum sp.]
MTKQEELLKCPIDENLDAKIEVAPQLVDNTLHLCVPRCVHLNSEEVAVTPKKRVVKTKMITKTQLQKATSQLYNLESCNTATKVLNIDLDLYQMEDY